MRLASRMSDLELTGVPVLSGVRTLLKLELHLSLISLYPFVPAVCFCYRHKSAFPLVLLYYVWFCDIKNIKLGENKIPLLC